VSAHKDVVAIGASMGCLDAIEKVLSDFTMSMPPVVMTLHMQPGVSKLFAYQMEERYRLSVKEAENGDILKREHVYIAPHGRHMKIVRGSGGLTISLFAGEKVNFCCPSVDVLLESVASVCGKNAVGAILTGIGADGAKGLLAMRNSGAETIGQDEKTSYVYGMPKAAWDIGAVMYVLPLNKIADKIMTLV